MVSESAGSVGAPPPRALVVTSTLATLGFSSGIGSIVVGRWRRAAFWLGLEVAFYAVAIVAILAVRPSVMWLGFLAALAVRVAAAVDARRLARRAVHLASWRVLVAAWLVLTLAPAALAAGVVRPFVVEAFKIPSKAMYPTLLVGDHIFVDKLHRAPHRGDIVVFRYPLDPSVDYVKRVVALAGDKVAISDGRLSVNDIELPLERYQEDCPKGADGFTAYEESIPCILSRETLDGRTYAIGTQAVLGKVGPIVVPPGQVYVLGDNRDNSSDSRVWGPLPVENVKGIVLFVWWSRGPSGVRWDRVGLPAT
ncbi:MAG TPA: signal peptidase I [Polyangia bacterium]